MSVLLNRSLAKKTSVRDDTTMERVLRVEDRGAGALARRSVKRQPKWARTKRPNWPSG